MASSQGKTILNAIPHNYTIPKNAAGEVRFSFVGRLFLDASTQQACVLEGRGIAYENLNTVNPFNYGETTFYSCFYPEASRRDMFYHLAFSHETAYKQRVTKSLYISAEVRYSLCTIEEAVRLAMNYLNQQQQQQQIGLDIGRQSDYFTTGNSEVDEISAFVSSRMLWVRPATALFS